MKIEKDEIGDIVKIELEKIEEIDISFVTSLLVPLDRAVYRILYAFYEANIEKATFDELIELIIRNNLYHGELSKEDIYKSLKRIRKIFVFAYSEKIMVDSNLIGLTLSEEGYCEIVCAFSYSGFRAKMNSLKNLV